MGGADANADDEPAFGAGGAIMEALAQSEPEVESIKPSKKANKSTKKPEIKNPSKNK